MKYIHNKKRGQSIVEWAIILPFLLLILMSIIELAPMLNTMQKVEKAAQYGARTGAAHGNTNDDILDAIVLDLQGMVKKNNMQAPVARQVGHNSTDSITYSEINNSKERTYIEITPGNIDERINGGWVMVKITYNYPIYTPLLSKVLNYNSDLIDGRYYPITRYAIYRIE